MSKALTHKRLVWRHRRFFLRASKRLGGKASFVGFSKAVASVTVLCSAVLLLAQGCATTPPPPPPLSQDVRASLGTVGVYSVGVPLASDIAGPVGTGKEAGRGAIKGAGIGGLSGAGIGAVAGLATGPCAPVMVPFLAGWGALGGFALGAGTGAVVRAVNAIPTETAENLQAALAGAVASQDLPDDLRQRVLGRAAGTPNAVIDLGAGNVDPSAPLDYAAFAASGAQSVLEVTITEVIFSGEGGRDPAFALSMKAQTRLIRIADNHVLWTRDEVVFRSEDADVSAWTDAQSGHLASQLKSGLDRLAQEIGWDVFATPKA